MGLLSKLKKVVKKVDPIGSKIASKSPLGSKVMGKSTPAPATKVTGGAAGAQSGVGRLAKVTGGSAQAMSALATQPKVKKVVSRRRAQGL